MYLCDGRRVCASALGTPRPWGRLWRDIDESPVFAPARRNYVLPHRLPPADSALWAGCLSLPWPGRRGGPAAGPWPPGQLAHSRPRTLCPGWGGGGGEPCAAAAPPGRGWGSNLISQQRPLNPGGSAPEGAQPPRAAQSCFVLLFICPRNLSK